MTGPRDWIDFANEDLELAKLALEKAIYNQTCFHAQQGLEKGLKAFLKTRQVGIPRIHGLSELVSLCRNYDDAFVKLEDACAKLDPYYIPTRYPDVFPGTGMEGLPTRQKAEEAVALLKDGLSWIESKIGK